MIKANKRDVKSRIQLKTLAQTWPLIADSVSYIRTKTDFERATRLLDVILDEVGTDTKHPLYGLMDHLGSLIEHYESQHLKESKPNPIAVLKNLMKEHKLKQADLRELGSQGVVSEILRGKRKLNTRQIKALCKRFRVAPATLL